MHFSSSNNHAGNNEFHHGKFDVSHNYLEFSDTESSNDQGDLWRPDKKAYSVVQKSELKLPCIDRSKSSSVTCLATETPVSDRMLPRGQSLDSRSRLVRSPAELETFDFWTRFKGADDHVRTQQESENAVSDSKHDDTLCTNKQESNFNIKFPSIFQHQKNNHNFPYSPPNSKNEKLTTEESHVSSREKPPFNGFSQHNLTLLGRKSWLNSKTESSNDQRSGPQTSALLLPISTCAEFRNPDKTKRKKKTNAKC